MVGGHVTTVSPTYTNGNINPLSLTTAGALRIDGSGVIHPVSQSGTWTVQQGTPPWSVVGAAADGTAVTGNPVLIGGQDGINVQSIATDGYGRPNTYIGSWFGSEVPTVGQKTKVNSIPVVLPSDQTVTVSVVPSESSTGLIIGIAKLGGGTANTINFINGTPYTEQTTNAQRSIASASANDTSAGTGARQVEIKYYDQTMVGPFTETVTLNGTTAVATSNSNICFIESIRVTSVGSGSSNAGIITLYVNNTGGGGTIGTIGTGNVISGAGDNRTFWGHHYVADGYESSLATLVASALVSGATATATFLLRARNTIVSTSPDIQVGEFLALNQAVVRALGIPIRLTGPARVTVYGIPSGNNTTLYASFDFSEQ
jgi:hypothetical protein